MPLAEEPTAIRNVSVNFSAELKASIDALIQEFETIVSEIADSLGLRRAMVRSQLQCNSLILLDSRSISIVAEVSKGMPTTWYFEVVQQTELQVDQALAIGLWDWGLFDGFAIQLPRNLVDQSSDERQMALGSIASTWVQSERQRALQQSQLIQISPLFGPARYRKRNDFCFVIGPFADENTEVYQSIIKPTVEELNLVCHRADEMFTNRAIMTDIWQSLCEARIIVADLTGRNANVLYELGIAHTLGKETILLSKVSEERIPFDIQGIRHIIYPDSPSGGAVLRTKLKATLENVLNPQARS